MKLLVAMNLSPRWIGNHGLDLQTEALARVGCKKALADKISGSRADAIDTGTPSGRFFFHVMASLAEMEHELAIERTRAGLAIARKLGRKGGTSGGEALAAVAHRSQTPAKNRLMRAQACEPD